MREDFPTLERPITANSGSLGLGHCSRLTLLFTYAAFFTRTCEGSPLLATAEKPSKLVIQAHYNTKQSPEASGDSSSAHLLVLAAQSSLACSHAAFQLQKCFEPHALAANPHHTTHRHSAEAVQGWHVLLSLCAAQKVSAPGHRSPA